MVWRDARDWTSQVHNMHSEDCVDTGNVFYVRKKLESQIAEETCTKAHQNANAYPTPACVDVFSRVYLYNKLIARPTSF